MSASVGDPSGDGRPTVRIDLPGRLAYPLRLEAADAFAREMDRAMTGARNQLGYMIRTGELAISECGHAQCPPTGLEIAGHPEIIARKCAVCARELFWTADRWKRL